MLVIRVELWSAGTGEKTEIARAHIANIGGDAKKGDYKVQSFRGRSKEDLNQLKTQREAFVFSHPRLSKHVWVLVCKALMAMGYAK